MKGSDAVLKVEVAGSARRRKETVGDLDVLASSLRPEEATRRFVTMPPVIRVISEGPTRSTVVLEGQIHVDLRVVAPEEYGSALLYFTGSKEHNIKLRTIASRRGSSSTSTASSTGTLTGASPARMRKESTRYWAWTTCHRSSGRTWAR